MKLDTNTPENPLSCVHEKPLYAWFEYHPMNDKENPFVAMDFNTNPGQMVISSIIEKLQENPVLSSITDAYKKRYLWESTNATVVVWSPLHTYPLFDSFLKNWKWYLAAWYGHWKENPIESISLSERNNDSWYSRRVVTQLGKAHWVDVGENAFIYLNNPKTEYRGEIPKPVLEDYLYRSSVMMPSIYWDIVAENSTENAFENLSDQASFYKVTVRKGKKIDETALFVWPERDWDTNRKFVIKDSSALNAGGKSVVIVDWKGRALSEIINEYTNMNNGDYYIQISPLKDFNQKYLINEWGDTKAWHARTVYAPDWTDADLLCFKFSWYEQWWLNNSSSWKDWAFFAKTKNWWDGYSIGLANNGNPKDISTLDLTTSVTRFDPNERYAIEWKTMSYLLDQTRELLQDTITYEQEIKTDLHNALLSWKNPYEVIAWIKESYWAPLPKEMFSLYAKLWLTKRNRDLYENVIFR